jgi:hypothetical protein
MQASAKEEVVKWARRAYWLGLLVFFSLLAWTRAQAFTTGKATAPDVVLLIVWLGLALTPIFHEVDVFGLKLKRQVEDLRREIAQIKISSNAAISQDTYNLVLPDANLPMPSEEYLAERTAKRDEARRMAEEEMPATEMGPQEAGAVPPEQTAAPREPTDIHAARIAFEKELRRIWATEMPEPKKKRPTWREMVGGLVNAGVLPFIYGGDISTVLTVSSKLLHGEDLTDVQVQFAQDVAPGLLEALKRLPGPSSPP